MSQPVPTLEQLGWTAELEQAFSLFAARGLIPARVTAEHRAAYEVVTAKGPYPAEVSGVFRRAADSKAGFPAVGDWAALSFSPGARRQTIQALMPRRTKLSRLSPEGVEQILAANIDTVFIVQGLDGDYNPKRLERYLAAAIAGGAEAVVILNKTDLDPQAGQKAEEIRSLGHNAPVLLLDSISRTGYEALGSYNGRALHRPHRFLRRRQVHHHQQPDGLGPPAHRRGTRGRFQGPPHHHRKKAVSPA